MEATLIYPHQLFHAHPALSPGRCVYLIEEPLLLTNNPTHRARLILLKLAMDAYEHTLMRAGYTVQRIGIAPHPKTADVWHRLAADGISTIHVADTTDDYLECAIAASGLRRVWYESPLFFLEKADAVARYLESDRSMAKFYKRLRKDERILVDADGAPTGGAWSFDTDNREPLRRDIPLPADIHHFGNKDTQSACSWIEKLDVVCYGEANTWLPYTHDGARVWLKEFLHERFHAFGRFEDAIAAEHTRLFHSTLSPLLNIGLLTPREVLAETLAFAEEQHVPINSLEGFIRQILGWREFMRAAYETDGRFMRTRNFFAHKRTLPATFWDATTGLTPVDTVIKRALAHGYSHHIERLMIVGNILLLLRVHPDEVYRWFMALYIDAYDWVMVPNVYGMSQFADGGRYATKPYISGSNYVKKMSNFAGGDWEEVWTALYWEFIVDNQEFFESNHRLAMMPRMYQRLAPETRKRYQECARKWLI